MTVRNLYLKPNVLVEPLCNQWYAWSNLISCRARHDADLMNVFIEDLIQDPCQSHTTQAQLRLSLRHSGVEVSLVQCSYAGLLRFTVRDVASNGM